MSAAEFEGVKAYGLLISEIKGLPDARKAIPVDTSDPDDDGTDWDFSGSMQLVKRRLEALFGSLKDTPFNRGFLKAMAWTITTEANGFFVDDEHFEDPNYVLQSFPASNDDDPSDHATRPSLPHFLAGRDLAVAMLREAQQHVRVGDAAIRADERSNAQQANFARAYLRRVIDNPRLLEGFSAVFSDVLGHSGSHDPELFASLSLHDVCGTR